MTKFCSARERVSGIPVPILGVPFDKITMPETVELVERMITSRQPHYIATANVDFIVQAQNDVELRRILFDADLVLCDGTPPVWISKWLNNPLPERVAGADLVPLLIGLAAKKGYRLFLLGAAPESAAKAVTNLQRQHPELVIAGHYSPPFGPLLEMDHDEISERIRRASPDILLVSFGCPKQEKWISMHYRSLGVPVSIGVGATIDFLAARMKRAPVWMRRTGTEWLFRLWQEPQRLFRRYARDLWVFGWRILVQYCSTSRARHPADGSNIRFIIEDKGHWLHILPPEHLDRSLLNNDSFPMNEILTSGNDCLLEMSRVKSIDNTGAGFLVRLHKMLNMKGRKLVLLSPAKKIRRALMKMRLDPFFFFVPDRLSAQRLMESLVHEEASAVTPRTAAAANPLLWQGEITAANADHVWFLTRTNLLSTRQRELVIDLSRVRFLDSSGVEIMLEAKRMAKRKGVKLSFTNIQPAVRNVLRHARFDSLLQQTAPETGSVAEARLVPARQI